jgi:hypothetical protein
MEDHAQVGKQLEEVQENVDDNTRWVQDTMWSIDEQKLVFNEGRERVGHAANKSAKRHLKLHQNRVKNLDS